jgi:hypothetical protein
MKQIISKKAMHIMSFNYEKSFHDVTQDIQRSSLFEDYDISITKDVKLNKYIQEKFNNNTFCRAFRLKPNDGFDLYFDRNKTRKTRLKFTGNYNNDRSNFEFSLLNVWTFYFGKNTGYLVIEYDIFASDVEDFIRANYLLKMLKGDHLTSIELVIKKGKDTYESKIVNVKAFIDNTLKTSYSTQSDAFENEAITYTGLLLNNGFEPSVIPKYTALLSRGYKLSYKLTTEEISDIITEKFDNIIWGTSLEGISCIATLTEDSITNTFLEHNFMSEKGAFSRVYFFIYLMALNQRHTLITVNGKLENIYREDTRYSLDTFSNQVTALKQLISEVNVNYINHDITQNSIYRSYYESIYSSLNIGSLILDYETKVSGLEQLYNILLLKQSKQMEVIELRREKKLRVIAKTGLIIALIAFLPNLETVIRSILLEQNIDVAAYPLMGTLLIIGITILVIYQTILLIIKTKKYNLKENSDGTED